LRFRSLRIAVLSGIFCENDYFHVVDERYAIRSVRDLHSAVYYRSFMFFQLSALSQVDIVVTHDWPSGSILDFASELLPERKRYLFNDDLAGTFGIREGLGLRDLLHPKPWFAAHHHVKLEVDIKETRFLALDKPRDVRDECWNEVVDVDGDVGDGKIRYSGEWIGILRATQEEMEVPRVLLRVNWSNRIERLIERLVIEEDAEVSEMDEPEKITIRFCQRFGVLCPNPEIRRLMTPESPMFRGRQRGGGFRSSSRTWRHG
jgi:hypothetical protein